MSGKKIDKKYMWLLLCVVVAGVSFGFFVPNRDDSRDQAPEKIQVRPVKYMVVKHNSNLKFRTFPGLVHEAAETRLAFRVGGTLQTLDIVVGQRVKKGDPLAVIDPRDYKINLARLEASLEEADASFWALASGARKEDIASLTAQVTAAKANLERSRKHWERMDNLIEGQIVSKVQYDTATADLSAAKAQYDTAVQELEKGRAGARKEDLAAAKARIKQLKASIKAAEYALEDTVLKAPFDGIINQKLAENFEAVSSGQHIVSLLDLSTKDVQTDIPEEIVLKRNSITKIFVGLDAYPEELFPAVVKELGLKTDPASQSFPLTVSLTVPDGIDIQPGMTASVKIAFSDASSDRKQNIIVPSTAVFSNEKGESCIWKIDMETLTLAAAKVTVKEIIDNSIIITNGLADGDHIVTAGARFLTRNQKIKLMEKSGIDAS